MESPLAEALYTMTKPDDAIAIGISLFLGTYVALRLILWALIQYATSRHP